MTTPFSELTLRGSTFKPALFCAPMADFSHSAFRRLIDDFGGCGAVFTEMISSRLILDEDVNKSPYLKRHPGRTPTIYQLMLDGNEPIEKLVEHLSGVADGLDVNLACHAWPIRYCNAGSRLFDNIVALASVLGKLRKCWQKTLTVKIRLGHDVADWREAFLPRLRVFEDNGVDAIILHPRFFECGFKRRARYELFPWAAARTPLPLVASGDITGMETVRRHEADFSEISGLMIGRLAIVRPWVFAAWEGQPVDVDHYGVWLKMVRYICEDFDASDQVSKIKAFTGYYARNFQFGHTLQHAVQNARTLDGVRARAEAFFAGCPALKVEPMLSVI